MGDAIAMLRAAGLRGPASDAEVAAWESRRDFERWREEGKARRLRRAEILDRELPGELTDDGRRTVVHEMRPHPLTADLVLSWGAAKDGPCALAVVGERGVGKTVAAAWWVADTDGRYVLSSELVRLWSAQYGPDRDRWESLKRARALVVDEIGGERQRLDDVRAMLEELINARQGSRTKTLLLGNITKAQWEQRLTPRAASRWQSVGYTLELTSRVDMRRRRRSPVTDEVTR